MVRKARIIRNMSNIRICREHNRTHQEARAAATEVAEDMAQRYGVEYHWHDDCLHFTRSGVDGTITIDAKQIEISAKLGFMLGMLKGPIEEHVNQHLDKLFG